MRINPRFINRFVRMGLNVQAYFTVGILIIIVAIIFFKGFPHVNFAFIFSFPEDMGREGGIFPSIVGTIQLALLSILLATPLGLGTAVFLTEYTKESLFTKFIRFGVESLAGIPSILYGLFGFIFFVIKLKMGWSLLAGVLTMTIMILPTIIRTSEEAIRSVPASYRDVSFAAGATAWQTVTRVVLPVAIPGIMTGVVLSIGRCVGETAAVIFTAGTALRLPVSIFSPTRTMAVHFYILAREGLSMSNAYGTAAVLIIAILVVNPVANLLMVRFRAKVT